MSFAVIIPPPPIITLEEAKLHVRVDEEGGGIEDNLITSYIAAATAWIDGPAGWLGRAIGVQVLEWSGDGWPCDLDAVLYPPLIELISIKYVSPDGTQHDWPVPDPLYLSDLPAIRGRPGDLKIQYRAGYGKLGDGQDPVWENHGVPEPIRVAVLMLVSQWYYNRDAVSESLTQQAMPFGVEALLSPYRVFR